MSVFQLAEHQPVEAILRAISLPDAAGLTAADAVVDIQVHPHKLYLRLAVGYPIVGIRDAVREILCRELASAFAEVEIDLEWWAPALQPANSQASVAGVKNIIAVASGKGGVGKSTTAANLALALAYEGARVGVLDADIYGPSQQQMLNVVGKRPELVGANMMRPIDTPTGLQMVSMGNLVTENTPMVWRGPMVSGALQQLLRNTQWTDVDYLIVDMPPGTGDIQLTLSQSVPVSGSVIVTTPQDIALLDAKKGIEMFRKVKIPVLGIVENMSVHVCSQCGHQEAIFGAHGGDRLAEEYGVEVLGRLPLQLAIREQTDLGAPPVAVDPDSEVSQLYRSIARQVAARLWIMAREGAVEPIISVTDD